MITFERCRVCPWTSLRSSRLYTRCTSCQLCCEHFSTVVRVPSCKRTVRSQRGRLCFRVNVGDLLGDTLHHHCSLKVLDIEIFIVMSATMALFVFRVSIPFFKNAGFLAISFSMFEIPCWSVSVTSTNSASDLLKSFASLVRGHRRRHTC